MDGLFSGGRLSVRVQSVIARRVGAYTQNRPVTLVERVIASSVY